jgi:signal transduction histidine kinase
VRLPIRARLTAWYAALLAAIMVALGGFLTLQLESDLEQDVEREVRAGSAQISLGYAKEGPADFRDVSRTVLPHGSSAAQVLSPGGRVLVAYGELLARRPIAPPGAFREALKGKQSLVTVRLGPNGQRFRGIVSPVRRRGRDQVLVVAESLRHVEESVDQVLLLLLLAGPAALAATALGGWWLARKALLPVGRMTSQAEEIGIDRLHDRIALPRARDEIRRLAETLNEMLNRLERGVEEKRRMVADASHELRTPLAAMRAELDVSLMADDLPTAGREVLESTREEVDRMSRIVDNLLTLARVDEGRLELLTTRVNLDEAADAAARPLRPLATAKNMQLTLNGPRCEAQADPQRLN